VPVRTGVGRRLLGRGEPAWLGQLGEDGLGRDRPDGGRFYATVYHFLTAADDYDRASCVHDGAALRGEMARHFANRPRVERVLVDAVEAEAGDAATVTARVVYADGTAGVVKVALRKGEPAWLVDWPATRALGE